VKRCDRLNWITEQLIKKNEPVSILDYEFVMNYWAETNVKCSRMKYGAPKCKILSLDLSLLFKQGVLKRSLCILPAGSMNEGFPNWIYMYKLINPNEVTK
jgi:hypothetical protein